MTSARTRLGAAVPVLATVLSLLWLPTGAARAEDSQPRGPVGGPLLGSTSTVTGAPESLRLPKVSAKSFLLADLDTGDVLAARNPHGRFRPASAIKVLTAVTLLPRLDPQQVYKATFEDANVEGSRVGIVPNGTYTVHNLFEGLFLTSGNDAARALAGAGGGLPQTVSRMNVTARELGAFDTTAKNASGLDEPGQYSSAYDLALIARAGMERPDFRAYARTVRSSFPDRPAAVGERRKTFEIYTQNKLVLNYRGAIGIKTGWTTQARGTFVGAATRNGRTLLVTVMNTGGGAWREARALLDWGFANASATKAIGTLNAIPAATAQVVSPKAPTAETASAGSGFSLGWIAWPVVALVALVVALRTRVLVKRSIRRRRRQANLRLARRLYANGVVVPQPPTAPHARAYTAEPTETRIGRSA